jgi:two-component system, LytTR family, response regulator
MSLRQSPSPVGAPGVGAPIKALIVDDEPLSRRAVDQLLARHADFVVMGECVDAVAAREASERTKPDVMFLDVRMPGLSGLELARDNGEALPLVVFVTAFDEFALPAFEVDAVDFLRKPITQQRFDSAVDRVRERIRLLAAAKPGRADRPGYLERLVTRVRDEDVVIPLDYVDHIAADDVYAIVHSGGRRYLVRSALDTLEKELDPAVFIRVHRSHIVAVRSIVAVRRTKACREVVLRDGTIVPVSRRRHSQLRAIAGRDS